MPQLLLGPFIATARSLPCFWIDCSKFLFITSYTVLWLKLSEPFLRRESKLIPQANKKLAFTLFWDTRKGKNSFPPSDRIIKYHYSAFHKTVLQSKQGMSTGECQQKEQETLKKREVFGGKLLQELQRTTNESNQLETSTAARSAAEQVLQEVAADYTAHYFHKEGGKGSAEQTVSQGNAEAAAGQQTGSSRKYPPQWNRNACTELLHCILLPIHFLP